MPLGVIPLFFKKINAASGPIQTFATHFGGDLLRMFESKDHEPNISF